MAGKNDVIKDNEKKQFGHSFKQKNYNTLFATRSRKQEEMRKIRERQGRKQFGTVSAADEFAC